MESKKPSNMDDTKISIKSQNGNQTKKQKKKKKGN